MQSAINRGLGALAALLALCACTPTPPAPAAAPPSAASTPGALAATRPSTPTATPTAAHIPTPTQRPTPTIRFSRPVTAAPTAQSPSDSTLVLKTADVYLTLGGDKAIDRVYFSETMRVIGRSADSHWYYVTTRRRISGWIKSEHQNIPRKSPAVLPDDTAGSVPDEPGPLATQGWQRLSIGENSLQLPPSWRSLPLEEAALGQLLIDSEPVSPTLAQAVQRVIDGQLYEGTALLAVDPQPDSAGISLAVMVQDRPNDKEASRKAMGAIAPLLFQNKGWKLLDEHSGRRVKGMHAVKLVYAFPVGDQPLGEADRGVLWLIYSRTHLYTLIFHGPASLASGESSDYSDLTEEIALSLTLGNPSEGETSE